VADVKFAAKRGGFQYAGRDIDRGQVFELVGARNDEKLERLGFIAKVKKTDRLSECGGCQTLFTSDGERDSHFKHRHTARPWESPEERTLREEKHAEREEKIANETAPLRLDRTKAILSGKGGITA